MHIGSIHVDPSVLAHQGLGHAAEGRGREGRAAGHAHGGQALSFAQVMAQQAAPTRPSAHHMAQVHAAQAHGRGRRRVDAQFHADDAAYADAVAAALGHGRQHPRAAQLGATQGLVAASMNIFPMGHESSSDDEE